jgi:crotonobetainyl-CoA:carnitine CoA-transferase CaiB-like acyl-CoA transferase
MQQPCEILASLWNAVGLPPEGLDSVRLTGADPVLRSSFRVGAAAQSAIAAAALAAGEIWHLRSGKRQQVGVDMRHAAVEFRSERYLSTDGMEQGEPADRIIGLYRCGDGGWVRVHTNFPHHRDGILRLLGCEYDRGAVQRALEGWNAHDLEGAAAERGLCATALRDFAEWDAHEQGRAVRTLPLVSIEKIGEAEPQALPPASRPLSGVRVLDLTRVIAGPVCGRTLAAHGADVLLVTSPNLPWVLVADTGRGKLSTHIDLKQPDGRATFGSLLREADVFVQGYRPGGVCALGFGPDEAARVRPGIVYVSLSAYGRAGPWAARRGFDSLVQTASGLNAAEAQAAGVATPKPLPAQALDHASGYLLAFGALAALHRRATEGGSWHVRVSLARTGHWLRSLGRVEGGFVCPDPKLDDVRDLLEETASGFGRLIAVRHAARMQETPPRWERPSVPLGTHPPRWPD